MKNFTIYKGSLKTAICLFLLVMGFAESNAQCTNGISYGSATAPTNATPVTISTCNYQEEYSTISSIVNGNTYSVDNSSGGCITVHSGTPGGPVVAYGPTPLSFTATSSGTYYLHYNTNCSCGTNTLCGTTTIACTSCAGGSAIPCSSILAMTGCGTAVSATMSGTGYWDEGFCGFSTPGVESIFSFTATSSGIHSIDVTSASGGYVDFAWKLATDGCSSTGWNCISDVLFTGSYGAMNWVAGETYYILLDPEDVASASYTFKIDCPNPSGPVVAGDCATAVPICTNVNFSIDPNGYGLVDEICYGCTSNPSTNPASANSGCLLSGELNSTWMVVNVAAGGTLEFSLGAPGGGNCYDWSMWPYNASACAGISGGTLAPIRCDYNGTCDSYTGIAATLPPSAFADNFEPVVNAATGSQYIICFSNYSSAVTTVPLNFFGTADISCTPLPVEIMSFSGQGLRGYNQLNWTTLVEINSAYFDIENSLDGINFTKAGTVIASGGADNQSNYEFKHDVLGVYDRYYRLKQVDENGMFKYSNTILVTRDPADDFYVVKGFPNPASEEYNVFFNMPEDGEIELNILASNGQKVVSQKGQFAAGGNIVKVPISNLLSGFYIVELNYNYGEAKSIVKLIIE